MADKRLYLIDAMAFCYRAFYALKGLSTSFGQPTNAIYGFLNILNKILKENNPDYLAVCFDVSRDTFRQKKFAEYKIQRPPMPDGLSSQVPLIKKIIAAYGIAIFEKEGYEADDIIATLVKKAKVHNLAVVIVSSDKDMLQLVDDTTVVLSPHKDEAIVYDRKKVKERFGVNPDKISDIIALMGDGVDNIPGASGIGEKTAKELVGNFSSLEHLLKNSDKIKQEKIKKIIKENIKEINLSKELAMLNYDLDIDFDLDKLKPAQPNNKELFRIFKYLEFKKLLKELPQEKEASEDVAVELKSDQDFGGLIGRERELYLYGSSKQDLIFSTKDKFFTLDRLGNNARSILEDPDIKKIGHDLKKIKISLAKESINLEGLGFDLMVAAYLLNPSKPQYELTDLSFDYLDKAMNEQNLSRQQAISLIVQLKPKLEEELGGKSLLKLFRELEMPLVEVLADMQLCGIKLDIEVLKKLSKDIQTRLIKLIEEIYSFSGSQFNINSPKQLREVLFEKLKLPVVKKNKTGPSTDEEVLRSLASRHKLPAFLLEYRQLTKLKNTYIDTLPDLVDKATGRLHSSFNQTVTETGRLSSSNPNLQNIPIKTDIGKNIRRAIVASDDDSCLLSCDYSQIELRILAHLSQDENLIKAFGKDQDIHRATASLIYGLDEDSVDEKMREVAKRVNFGIVYGLSSYGLSRDLGISIDGAQGFIDAYFVRYPKVKEYIGQQIEKAQRDGFVVTLLGRRRYIPEINNKNQGIRQFAQRQAVNTPIQGSASDLIKLAMVDIHNKLERAGSKAKMILQIHDELVFDLPRQELKGLPDLVKDRMENVLKLSVPIKVDMKKGRNWLEMEDIE